MIDECHQNLFLDSASRRLNPTSGRLSCSEERSIFMDLCWPEREMGHQAEFRSGIIPKQLQAHYPDSPLDEALFEILAKESRHSGLWCRPPYSYLCRLRVDIHECSETQVP